MGAAAFSLDKPVLATGSEGTVHLWNVANARHPTPLGEPLAAHDSAVVSLAFVEARTFLSAAMRVGRFACGGSLTQSIPFPSVPPLKAMTTRSIRSPAVRTGASSRLGTAMVKLWDLAPQRPVPLGTLLAGHGQAVNSVTFSPDGQTLAAAADDGLVTLWDMKDPSNPRPLGPALRAHGDPVTSSHSVQKTRG